jgi:hypothetical protein
VDHGIWDYDFDAAPNLVDITVDGRNIKSPPRCRSRRACTCGGIGGMY